MMTSNTSSRQHILTNIRRQLYHHNSIPAPNAALHTPHNIAPYIEPVLTHTPPDDYANYFAKQAIEQKSDIVYFNSINDIIPYIETQYPDNKPYIWCEEQVKNLHILPWGKHGFTHKKADATCDNVIAIHYAYKAIAETGTLMMISGNHKESLMSFLPAITLILVHKHDIVASYEDAWQYLRAAMDMPRNVHFITGPSRTGDIAQTIEIGAHGPLRLIIGIMP